MPRKQLITYRQGKEVGICQLCDLEYSKRFPRNNQKSHEEALEGNLPNTDLCEFHKDDKNRPKEWK